MPFHSVSISKIQSKRERLSYGEQDERRERNDKRHKPKRKHTDWSESPLVAVKPKA